MNELSKLDPIEAALEPIFVDFEERAQKFFYRLPYPVKAMVAAMCSGIVGCENLFGINDVPLWAQKQGREIRKLLMPDLDDQNIADEDYEKLGRLMGVLRSTLTTLIEENPKLAESGGIFDGMPALFLNLTQTVTDAAGKLPNKHHEAFFKGYGTGLRNNPLAAIDKNGIHVGRHRFTLRLIIALAWPQVMKQENTPRLHAFLAKALGLSVVGELDSFSRRMREMGVFSRSKPHAN